MSETWYILRWFGVMCMLSACVDGSEWNVKKNILTSPKQKYQNFLKRVLRKRSVETPNDVFPWHVFIPVLRCSGVLVRGRFVVTSASCLSRIPPNMPFSAILVRVGNHHINVEAPGEDTIPVLHVLTFPKHGHKNSPGNIAVLYLARDVMQAGTSRLSPTQLLNLPLVSDDASKVGSVAKVMGWGHHSSLNAPLSTLHHDSVFISGLQFCKSNYKKQVNDDMLCVYNSNGSLCSVDGGSPLIAQNTNDSWILLGIFAWGNTCEPFPKPAVFTKINSEMIRWLESLLRVKGTLAISCF